MVRRVGRLLASVGTKARRKTTFKQQYEEAERRRAAILQRLAGLNEAAREHPAYRRARTLLNQTFRKASVAQRLATLQAAEWLIDVLENLTTLV
jgi:cytochrome P450